MADSFDHLDGYQLVVLALQVAVILQQQGDAVLQAGFVDAPTGIGELFGRHRGGGYPAAVVACRVNGQAAPAGADLQQVIVAGEGELLADALQLVVLGLFQGIVGP